MCTIHLMFDSCFAFSEPAILKERTRRPPWHFHRDTFIDSCPKWMKRPTGSSHLGVKGSLFLWRELTLTDFIVNNMSQESQKVQRQRPKKIPPCFQSVFFFGDVPIRRLAFFVEYWRMTFDISVWDPYPNMGEDEIICLRTFWLTLMFCKADRDYCKNC